MYYLQKNTIRYFFFDYSFSTYRENLCSKLKTLINQVISALVREIYLLGFVFTFI